MDCNFTLISRFLLFLKLMIKGLKKIHRIYTVFVIVFFFLLLYPFYYIFSRKPEGYKTLNKLRKFNSLLCSFFTGIFFRLTYEEKLNSEQTYIYCANHSSNLDIMIFCVLASGKFHFMGKEELLSNPMFRVFFSTIDIPVNRENNRSAFRAFKRAGEDLEKGMSLVIFPEGKIDEEHYPPKLLPFKNGPFRLAIEKKTPLVPVTMCNVWKKMWDDGAKYGSSPGICDIYIHKAIPTENFGAKDTELLKMKVFEMINSKMHI